MSRLRAPVSVAGGLLVLVLGVVAAAFFLQSPPVTTPAAAAATATPSATSSASPSPSASIAQLSPSPTPSPTPTPPATPSLVAGPLDGLPTTPAAAAQHPIAVMIDDLRAARPQSGFSAASIVWQAPAEGGIPRYMLLFNERLPRSVGPIRSARLYYIAWASEFRSVYVHVGGSPQALAKLRAKGHGQLVYNADGYVYEGRYLFRITSRQPPHNEYSDAAHLRSLAAHVGAKDGPVKPAWTFGPDAAPGDRPTGGALDVSYPYNKIHYAYDRHTNTYRRSVIGERKQVDAATGTHVAPKNVITIVMHFGPLNDGHPEKKRLEANFVGSGRAWVSTNGRTIRATWRKTSTSAPTRLFDAAGHAVTLTAGQTFVQVVPSAADFRFKAGREPARPARDVIRPELGR